MPDADWWAEVARQRPGGIPHLEFLAELHKLLARHGYTMATEFGRIVVYDSDGRAVCSFAEADSAGAKGLRFG
jgi:hypothetical protein